VKNISIALNIVLLIAVVVLYILHFSDKKGAPASNKSKADFSGTALSVAYVNSDSLIRKFSLYDEMKKTFEEKRSRMENDYASKARSLEGEITSFQKSAQMMSPGEIKAREENLMMKRQNLMQYQEQLSQQLMQDEMQMNDSLYNKITSFIRNYSKEKDYDMIFGYSKGAGILYAHDSLEITKEVLAGLNDQQKKKDSK
jgi:outer membrane protein